MNNITTKRNFLKFYIPVLTVVFFFWAMGFGIIFMGIHPSGQDDLQHGGQYILPILGAAIILLDFIPHINTSKMPPSLT